MLSIVVTKDGKMDVLISKSSEDPIYNRYTLKAELPKNYKYISIVVNNYMICVGSRRKCFMFNPRNMIVEEIAAFPQGFRFLPVGIILSNKVDVFTLVSKHDDDIMEQYVMRYSFVDNIWTPVIKLPYPNAHIRSGCLHCNVIYMMGKIGNDTSNAECIFISVDTISGNTSRLPNLGRSEMVITHNDRVMAKLKGNNYSFDTDAQKWIKIPKQMDLDFRSSSVSSDLATVTNIRDFHTNFYRRNPVRGWSKLTFPYVIPDACIIDQGIID